MIARIEKIVHGGYGVARMNGRSCLVPFAAPGDLLEIECGSDPAVSFGWIKEVLEPSPHRRESRCPVFGLCGGCEFDHIDYACELAVKRDILLEDLARIGKTRVAEVDSTVSSREYGYRNHAQFKVGAAGKPGFFAKKSHEVVPLPAQGCLLLHPAIDELIGSLVDRTRFSEGGFRVRTNGEGEIYTKGVPGLLDDAFCFFNVGGVRMRLNIDDFFQVNQFLVERWVEKIVEYLEPELDDEVADIYCGSGIVALKAAPLVRSVVGIEMNRNAVRSARYNAGLNGLENAAFVGADAQKGLRDIAGAGMRRGAAKRLRAAKTGGTVETRWVNKIVVDPPRAGLTKELIGAIASIGPRIVVYASCDTATFARDVASFGGAGYDLKSLCLVDMFPRTRHSEIVSKLVRAGGRAFAAV